MVVSGVCWQLLILVGIMPGLFLLYWFLDTVAITGSDNTDSFNVIFYTLNSSLYGHHCLYNFLKLATASSTFLLTQEKAKAIVSYPCWIL